MSDDWYTPPRIMAAAREVLGQIDLDPASCEEANKVVQANRFYTKEQNGLQLPWHGRVWLNPPFGRRQTPGAKTNQGLWVQKLVEEYEAGNIEQAILLTTCRPDTQWFHYLWSYPICFADHKIGFYIPSAGKVMQECAHAHGTLFVYFGENIEQFTEVFLKLGPVVDPSEVRRREQLTKQGKLWQEAV